MKNIDSSEKRILFSFFYIFILSIFLITAFTGCTSKSTLTHLSSATGEAQSSSEIFRTDEHDGIYALISQNQNATNKREYYPDIDTFLKACSFDISDPFFQYSDINDVLQMTLYYDKQFKKGCGIVNFDKDASMFSTAGMYGFTFATVETKAWDGFDIDYTSTLSVDGTDGSADSEKYQEHFNYNDDGRISRFSSQGILKFIDDSNEMSPLLEIDYTYNKYGDLQYRSYKHNPYVFGTWSTTRDSFFDEEARLLYENIYVTHGYQRYYYIYDNNKQVPSYCLALDFNTGDWIPSFIEYTN